MSSARPFARPLPPCAGAGRPASTTGQKPHAVSDAIFTMAYKVYCGYSARRFSTDLLEAYEKGFISRPIPGIKATAFLTDPYYTPILKELIGYSARPLRSVERDFAIDSSGFSTCVYERWYDQKYGITRDARHLGEDAHCLWRENERRYRRPHSGQGCTRLPAIRSAREGDEDSFRDRRSLCGQGLPLRGEL